jgi:hypothetical protein
VDQRGRRTARYVAASIEKTLGTLPVVADYCRRLDLAGIIDRACPIRDLAYLSHGQVIETLIANRLTSPTPLVRISDWAHDWAVEEVFGIDPATLNDDRIGRALDAIAPELDHIVGSIGAHAITAFGIDTSQLHWDMTCATRKSRMRVNSQIGGRFCRLRSSRPVFKVGPRSDVRQQVQLAGVRSSGKKPKGPRSVRGDNRVRGRLDGRT